MGGGGGGQKCALNFLAMVYFLRLMNNVRAMEGVKYVEHNQIMKALQTECELQIGATWGLVRTTLHDWNTNPNDPPNEYEHNRKGMFGTVVAPRIPSNLFTHTTTQGNYQKLSLLFAEGKGVEIYIIDP